MQLTVFHVYSTLQLVRYHFQLRYAFSFFSSQFATGINFFNSFLQQLTDVTAWLLLIVELITHLFNSYLSSWIVLAYGIQESNVHIFIHFNTQIENHYAYVFSSLIFLYKSKNHYGYEGSVSITNLFN